MTLNDHDLASGEVKKQLPPSETPENNIPEEQLPLIEPLELDGTGMLDESESGIPNLPLDLPPMMPETPAEEIVRKKRSPLLWLIPLAVVLVTGLAIGGLFLVNRWLESKYIEQGGLAVQQKNWAEAETVLTKALNLKPNNWLAHTDQAYALRGEARHQLKKDDEAVADCQTALQVNPAYLQCQIALGEIYSQRQQADQAITAYSAAIELDANLPTLYLERAKNYNLLGKDDNTIKDCQTALSKNNAFLECQVMLGAVFSKRGEVDNALQAYAEAIKLDPKQATFFIERAQLFMTRADLDSAIKETDAARKLDDTLSLPYALEAIKYYQSLKYDEALKAAEAAIVRENPIAAAYRVRGGIAIWQYEGEGVKDLETALTMEPDDGEALAMQVFYYLEAGDLKAAKQFLDKAVATAPEAASTLWAQALVDTAEYRYTAGLENLKKAIAIDGRRPEYFVARGDIYRANAKLDDSLSEYEAALGLLPGFAPALAGQGWIYYARYQEDLLKETAQTLQAEFPKDMQGPLLMAAYYFRTGKYDDALTSITKAIDLAPDLPQPYLLRGDVNLKLGEYEEALSSFEKAENLELLKPRALTGKGSVYLAQGEFEKALTAFDEALEIDSQFLGARLQRVNVYIAQEDYSQADDELQPLLEAYPEQPEVLFSAARLAMAMENYSVGLKHINKVIETDSTNLEAYLIRAKIYVKQTKYSSATKDLEKIEELGGNFPEVYLLKARIAYEDADWEATIEEATRAIELDARQGEAYELRGLAYMEQEKYAEAAEDLGKAVELTPDLSEDTYYKLSQAHKWLGDVEAALKDLDHVKGARATNDRKWLEKIPPVKNGKRTYSGDHYIVTAPTRWLQAPTSYNNQVLDLNLLKDKADFYIFVNDGFSRTTVRAVVDYYIRQISSNGWEVIEDNEITVNGMRGIALLVEGSWKFFGQSNQRMQAKTYFFIKGDYLAIINGEAHQTDFTNSLEKEFDDIVESFELLTSGSSGSNSYDIPDGASQGNLAGYSIDYLATMWQCDPSVAWISEE